MSASTDAARDRWRLRNPGKVKLQQDSYNRSARRKEVKREYTVRIKNEVLTHYGPNGVLGCCWPGCDVMDIDMLSLDHKNNNGAEHRRVHGKYNIYALVKRWGFPDDVQTLCMNHQWKKRMLALRAEGE